MRITLNNDWSYSFDQQEAINELLRTKGLADAISTRTPIDDDCYKVTKRRRAAWIIEQAIWSNNTPVQ